MLKLGKDEVFFRLLNGQAEVARRAADAFLAMVKDLANHESYVGTLAKIETDGDNLTHELQNTIMRTFITPLDQEDLAELSNVLDDITDFIEAVGSRIALYRLREARPDLEPLAVQIVECTRLVVTAVNELSGTFSKSATLSQTLQEIHRVENESDKLFRGALGRLFDEQGIDPLTVMKWKEVYDRIENAVDRCEDVAKIVDNLIVKYA